MKTKIIILLVILGCVLLTLPILAHSGRTDSNGGHYDHSTGEYHYHHGYSAHKHYDIDGDGIKDCPKKFKTSSNKAKWDLNIDKIIVVVVTGALLGPYCYLNFYSLLEANYSEGSKSKIIAILGVVILIIIFAIIMGYF